MNYSEFKTLDKLKIHLKKVAIEDVISFSYKNDRFNFKSKRNNNLKKRHIIRELL